MPPHHAALAAIDLANDFERQGIADVERLQQIAEQRTPGGRLTPAAKEARKALTSPALTSTLPSVALKRSINPAIEKAIVAVERDAAKARTSAGALKALMLRKDLYESAVGVPRKRVTNEHHCEPEEWKFLKEMRVRKVPISAIDQLSGPEYDFIATLFVEKQQDPRHRLRAGAWWAMVRTGSLDISSEAFNDDERAAILAATAPDHESGRLAYEALCELAGRELDIPPVLAEFILEYARHSSPDNPIGAFEKNVSKQGDVQRDQDARSILAMLGLSMSDVTRAWALMRIPPLISYEDRLQRVKDRNRELELRHDALVDMYLPAAEAALTERHENERRKQRDLIGADEMGMFDKEEALRRLGAYDDDPTYEYAVQIRQIRSGTYFKEFEDERRQTVRDLAEHMAVSQEIRDNVARMGIVVPSPTKLPSRVTTPARAQMPTILAGLAFPEWVTPDAALAYYEVAKEFSAVAKDWMGLIYPPPIVDRGSPSSVEDSMRQFAALSAIGSLDELSSRYFDIMSSGSIDEANAMLIAVDARNYVVKIATVEQFKKLRQRAGFPSPSDLL